MKKPRPVSRPKRQQRPDLKLEKATKTLRTQATLFAGQFLADQRMINDLRDLQRRVNEISLQASAIVSQLAITIDNFTKSRDGYNRELNTIDPP
jgi:hypothetical protein